MKHQRSLILGYLVFLSFLIISCNEKKSMDESEHDETNEKSATIDLSKDEIAEFDITIGKAQSG